MIARAIAAGVVLGVAATMSPLTVLMLPAVVVVARRAGRDLPPVERSWLYRVITVAVVVRLAAVAGLFLFADDRYPFANFFGDEELFKHRSIWLRNIGLGVPISTADFIYALEETGKSQYLSLLAYIQALVGDAPYGIHVLNMVLYLAAALALYRFVRASYGNVVAMSGLIVLLFLPSLLIWSISALKEPLYTALAVAELACVLHVARTRKWWSRLLAVAGIVAAGFVLEGLRKGGLLVAGFGAVGGLTAAFVVKRPRLLLASAVAAPVALVVALSAPAVQERLLAQTRAAAIYHVGHVFTPGYSYKTLDYWYYISPADISRMPPADAARFVVRSFAGYVVQPLPWTIESRAVLAYVPEYVIWLTLVALVPAGVIAGVRRDATLTCVLLAHGVVVVTIVALTSGNVGTLIRHRGLALPYFVWFSMLGLCRLMQRASATTAVVGDQTLHAYR